jgi:hypothetical protein
MAESARTCSKLSRWTELREEVGAEFGDEGSEADHRGAPLARQ